MPSSPNSAFVHWPDALLTERLVRGALNDLGVAYLDAPTGSGKLLQWSTYDSLDHERVLLDPKNILSSSYTFRKALIRKHFLSRVTHVYTTKHPDSILKVAIPETYDLELTFADELDEMWLDDLYELGDKLEAGDAWWILKPGMADRGMGIRLFNSKDQLQRIFEGFESDDDGEDGGNGGTSNTAIVTSQLRHFVVQEYLPTPLLFDPHEIAINGKNKEDPLSGHKFHLRVYCVASGALQVYIYTRILALFAPVPYATPQIGEDELEAELGDEYVRLFDELIGRHILSGTFGKFTEGDLNSIVNQVSDVLADTFRAAVDSPPLPNAFELYGVDFLVSDTGSTNLSERFQVHLLEINAEPAIEMTGPRLTWVLEDLFKSIAQTCVKPFFAIEPEQQQDWLTGEVRSHLKRCLGMETRSWD